MRVDEAALRQILQSYNADRTGGAGKGQRAGGGAAGQSDQITISPEGQELQRLIQAAHLAEDVRTEVVEEVRTRIRTGAYLLDPQSVANKMLGLGEG
jgi:flagellar biosynthesis anti-sigma factor FlgM